MAIEMHMPPIWCRGDRRLETVESSARALLTAYLERATHVGACP